MILKFRNSDKKLNEKEKGVFLSRANKILKEAEKEKNYGKAVDKYREAAGFFRDVKNFEKSTKCEKNIIERAEKEGREFDIAWAHRGIALDLYELGEYDEAVKNAKTAAKNFGSANSFYAVKWCYNDIAMIFESKKDIVSALEYYNKSNSIERENEIEKKIDVLMNSISHPTVNQSSDKVRVVDGENVRFTLKLKNETKEKIENIYVMDENGSTLNLIDSLKPSQEKEFSYDVKAKGTYAEPPYFSVVWKSPEGNILQRKIERTTVEVDQKVNVNLHVKNKLTYGKETYFAITVKNQSTTPIQNVKLHLTFPIELKVKAVTGYKIENIGPEEEKSFIFKIVPLNVGKNFIENAFIEFTNEKFEQIKIPIKDFILEEVFENEQLPVKSEPKPLTEKEMMKVEKIHEDKKYIYTVLAGKKTELPEYVSLTKKLHSETYGYTLKGVDTKTVYMHVMEELKSLYVVSTHWNQTSSVLMFSAQSFDGETYLLTVALDMKGDTCNVAFRIYSSKEKDLKEILVKIADIINYTIIILSMAKEIEKIEVKEVINIIDSVVQRSKLGTAMPNPEKGDKKIEIKDSVVQRTET
ncbi:MAG: tetratricopeptide repeat protein [Candidatus Aenigmarchaeota archaeon]|nr:tetratricopeptide repeat protein [Candidatus Aenigmarchaeota archaeon]